MKPRAAHRAFRDGVLLVLACVLLNSWPAAANDDLLTVRATAHVQGQGLTARRRALDEAARDALAQYVHRLVVRTEAVDLAPILRRTPEFIRSSELLRFDEMDGGTRIEADIGLDEAAVHHAIAQAYTPPRGEPVRMVLLLGEQLPMDTAPAVLPDGLAERVLRERLEKVGVEVSGAEAADALYSHPELVAVISGGVEAGGAFARAFDADVVAVGLGRGTAKPEASGSNVFETRAMVELRFYRPVDGKMVDSVSVTQVVHGADMDAAVRQALRDAAVRMAGPARTAACLAYLGAQPAGDYRLTLVQPGNRERLEAVVAHLRRAPGVRGIQEAAYDPGEARLLVDFDGPVMALADLLDHQALAGGRLVLEHAMGQVLRVSFSD